MESEFDYVSSAAVDRVESVAFRRPLSLKGLTTLSKVTSIVVSASKRYHYGSVVSLLEREFSH